MESSTWRKSSYSQVGSNCLEVTWAKSSHSQGNGNCLEAKFQKSSYSNSSSGNCLEARFHKSSYSNGCACEPDDTIIVRDSKNPEGGVLEFSPDSWLSFLAGIKSNEF